MHSLKNTIVAVGLLGLSFLFYQASTKPKPELSGLVPPLEISEGLDDATDGLKKLASDGIGAVKSKLNDFPKVEMPDLSKPKQMVSDFANEASNKINGQVTHLKNQFNDFQNRTPQLNSPQLNVPDFQPKVDAAINQFAPSQGLELNPPISSPDMSQLQPSNQFSPETSNQLSLEAPKTNARDEGLIAALESQNIQPPATNQFPPTTNQLAPANDNSFQGSQSRERHFASQTETGSDSSFNQLAANVSTDTGFDVMRADNSEPSFGNMNFQEAWGQVDKLVKSKKYRDALRLLSGFYHKSDLTGPQRQRLLGWLDALAGKVIFSTENHLDIAPYTVANESLTDISRRWKVPAQLVYNINASRIDNPANVAPGTELKVIPGPFRAEVDMSDQVMTLFLGELYAGRYPVRIGISGDPKPGSHRVLLKSADGHAWRDANGIEYPPGSSENGYGPNWIGLSGSLCIHAINDSVQNGHRGCIGLSLDDSKDVFAILGTASSVKLVR